MTFNGSYDIKSQKIKFYEVTNHDEEDSLEDPVEGPNSA
jgi:hypothetical protein